MRQEFMPIMEKLKESIRKQIKNPKKLPKQMSKIAAANANLEALNPTNQRANAMNDFVEGIQARAEFYNLAKHGNDALVNSKTSTDPVAGFID